AVLAFVAVVVSYLLRIVRALESIGGKPDSYLAKLGFGVRAIEMETSHLAPQVIQLNEGLTALAGGLGAVERDLGAVAGALNPAGSEEGS
ncbi:MAG: hypothetical protein ACRD1H_05435, partial [Vicinamibacterales bacterium]